MTGSLPDAPAATRRKAEFDLVADQYMAQHTANIAITGEAPDYFAQYKIADVAAYVEAHRQPARNILDFGCGIGNSIGHFRTFFPSSSIVCADVSARSIQIAQERFPGSERYELVEAAVPVASASQDIVFSACVFHHIPSDEHGHWLAELRRVTRPGGLLIIYEHNPLNPLTVNAVNTCPFDVNAKLIKGRKLRQQAAAAGWSHPRIRYKVFFPAVLRTLRPLEKRLEWLALGAQYRLVARCPG